MFSTIIRPARKLALAQRMAISSSYDEFTEKANEEKAAKFNRTKRADSEEALKAAMMDEALKFVASHGWSREAVRLGAIAAGYPAISAGLIKNIDLVHHHYSTSNDRLAELMRSDNSEESEVKKLRSHVEARLRMNEPYLSRWPQALALMALPANTFRSLQLGLELADALCHGSGDRSTDGQWYTKRLGVLAIYKATELAMMQDSSADFKETFGFLDRRFDEATQLYNYAGPLDLTGIGTTLQVLLGVQNRQKKP